MRKPALSLSPGMQNGKGRTEGSLHAPHAHAHKVVVGEGCVPAFVQQPDALGVRPVQRDEQHGRGAPHGVVRSAFGRDQVLGIWMREEQLERLVPPVAHRSQNGVPVRASPVEVAAGVEKGLQDQREAKDRDRSLDDDLANPQRRKGRCRW